MSYLNSFKQDTLVSGTNIKTINGSSILGSGNLVVTGSGASWGSITGTLSSQTDLNTALSGKQASLSGTGIVKSTAGTISYLTDNTSNWDNAYTNRITSLTTTGSSGSATLSSNTLNVPTYTLTGLGGVATTRTISTNAPLSGGGDLSADRTLSISQATTSTDGYLSSTDWNTFNGKQAALVSGTNIKTINGSSVLGSGDLTVNSDPLGFTSIIKSANQDVTNSATLVDDTELQFSVVAGGYYMVEMHLVYSGNDVTGDYKWQFTLSTGTMRGNGGSTSLGTAGGAIFSGLAANNVASATVQPNGVAVASLDSLHSCFCQFNFWVSNNATFKFQFANNTAGAGRISRTNKGTYLKYKKIN